MSDTLFASLADELITVLSSLEDAATDPDALDKVLRALGVPSDPGSAALTAAIGAVVAESQAIEALVAEETPSFDAIGAALAGARRAFEAIKAVGRDGASPQLDGLGRDFAELLAGNWLAAHPLAHRVAVLLTLVELAPDQPLPPASGRLPYRIDRLHPERLVELLRDPAAVLRAEYGNALMTAGDADAMADKLFPRILGVLRALGLTGRYGVNPRDEAALGDSLPLLSHALAVYLDHPLRTDVEAQAGAVFYLSPADRGDLGLVASPFGALTTSRTVGPFELALRLSAGVQALAYGRHGFTLLAGAGTTEVTASVVADQVPLDDEPPYVIGSSTGTRIELSGTRLAIETALSQARQTLALSADVKSASVVVAPGDGDGFLAAVLPRDGLRADFSTGIAWSNTEGLRLRGSAGLEADLPIGLSLAGLTVPTLHVGLRADDDAVSLHVSAAVKLRLGPVEVGVDGVGVRGALTFPEDGNLGVADLDLGFKPPTALSLAIDAGPVTGGGTLAADPERGQYAGEVHLQFEGIAVRAVGLLTTQLPDGRPGFSLLALVSAEFPPVQLGLGFRLVGVGGLLGINRTVAVEALRAGLKTGALSAVLTPPDPKANAGQLVATLAGLFPAAPGRHVFAPTARIVWGAPTLITIDLCLALELPSPVRLVALGRMRAVLPDEREPIVRLQVDVLGVIDFGRSEAAVDATLVDSRLAQFALTGDMAFRLSWGAQSSFLLAVGGFHPRFAAPPGFPELQRVAVALASGDNPKLRLEAYLAVTSNTVQFGARVDLGARAGSFSIAGFLSFDALLTIDPLEFEIDIAAKLAVKMGSRTLLAVSLALTLSGPEPWRARGRASFSILFLDVSFGFDISIGDEKPAALPSPVDVAPLVLAALTDARAWTAQMPAAADVVTLRKIEPGTAVLAHPLATLEVRQRVAPLERTLERFGTSVPSGARLFRITQATIGGVSAKPTPLRDQFAPAQFSALSDDAKLSAPSFEEMVSGAALGADGFATGPVATLGIVYEQVLVTAAGIPEPKPQKLPLPAGVFAALTATPPRTEPVFAMRVAA